MTHNLPPSEIDNEHFKAWTKYWGLLATVDDINIVTGEPMTTRLFAYENCSQPRSALAALPPDGALFGYVVAGAVTLWDWANRNDGVLLRDGRWFALPGGGDLHLHERSRVVVSQRVNFLGIRAFGGPIEPLGRLRYIDGCSDTILAGPPVLGDPCFNHLHFPMGIEQTFHTHPSIRCGAVAKGRGFCDTPYGRSTLAPGVVFMIPTGGEHRFVTDVEQLDGEPMDVIAYHPDSDWGPTDEDHPMINRTWVNGAKIASAEATVVGR